MTPAQRDQIAMPVVLVYWLLVIGGLVVHALLRLDDPSAMLPLWVGAVGGTLLGQALALHDFRLGATAIIVAFVTAIGAQLVPVQLAGRELWLAFVPAALCGYWSLGDRSALAAYWFPAVIWMLSILDRSDGSLTPDGAGVALLAVLAVMFVGFLRVRESRRIGLWRTVAAVPLAPAGPVELLRTPPNSQLARAGWGLSVSAITVAITAWVAPALWQIEPLAPHRVQVAHGPVLALPCCPVMRDAELERARVKEYFDIGRGHDRRITRLRPGFGCAACDDIESPAWPRVWPEITARTVDPPRHVLATPAIPDARATAPAGQAAAVLAPAARPAPAAEPTPGPAPAGPRAMIADEPPPTAWPPSRPATVETPRIATRTIEPSPPLAPPRAAAPSRQPPAASVPQASSAPVGPSVLRWLVLLGTAALTFQLVGLALRPLRRLVTLRHLRRPFWDETVVQRVSNAWQLALVGLRDAGWRTGASETPQELARRVDVDGLERCATILERARHGIAVDGGDLGDMQAAADVAYHAARREVPRLARALGWLRWPLT